MDTNQVITELVERHKAGDLTATEELLTRFSSLIKKYLRLLTRGSWNRNDKDIQSFLKMLGGEDLERTSRLLPTLLHGYDKDDLEQEAKLAFIETANSYTNISRNYKFQIKNRIKNILKTNRVNISYVDIDSYSNTEVEIDEMWIEGVSCGNAFSSLSPTQRRILKLIYLDRHSKVEVASMLNLPNRYYLDVQLKRAVDTLKKFYRTEGE